MIYTKQWATQILELLPDAKAIAVDNNGLCCWFDNIPEFLNETWQVLYGQLGSLGKVDLNGLDWKDSLVVRKWVPKEGEEYYMSIIQDQRFYTTCRWNLHTADFHRLTHNLVFKTKEEAIARSKELLGIKE